MFVAKELGKFKVDQSIEIEDQLLYLSEVPNGIRLLEFRMNEIVAKGDRIDEMVGHLETMSIRELMVRVKALEVKPQLLVASSVEIARWALSSRWKNISRA